MIRPPRRPPRIGRFTHIHREPGAWAVQVTRRGRIFTGHFADAVWGGRDPALLAAQRFRDRLLLRIGPDTRVRRRVPKRRPSKTGEVGVTYEEHPVGGRVYGRFVGGWRDADGRQQRRRFLVQRYGWQGARARARRARRAGVAKTHADRLRRQREEAAWRLKTAPPMPRRVKDPFSRKGISMARRRRRRAATEAGGTRATW